MAIIKESFELSASDADVLAAPSRMAAIPKGGILTIEASARLSSTNNGQLTLQLPGGGIPFENLIIPANGFSTAENIMHTDTQLTIILPVEQGGHVLLSYVEAGTVVVFLIITLNF